MSESRTPSSESLARIARLELEARGVVEGFLSGNHRSPFFGQSLEFAQHREYVPGDDTRRIDWKAWSKTDKLYLKQYEEETNLRVQLLVDCSESMRFGTPGQTRRAADGRRSKFDQACLLAASLAYLFLRQQDSVGLTTFDEGVRRTVPPRTSNNHLRPLLDALIEERAAAKTGVLPVLKGVADAKTSRGLIVILSDLFIDRDELRKGLMLLRQRGHEVIVLQTLDGRELDFDFSGTTRFVGLEESGEVTCDPRSLRDGYLDAMQRFLEEVQKVCSGAGCDYEVVRTDEAPEAVLARLINRRRHARR